MSNENMRDEFEAWISADSARDSRAIRIVRDRDWYVGRDKHLLNTSWSAWKASRAAVVLQMPQQSGVNRDWNQAIRYCIQAVEAEGLGWKP